MDKNAIVKDMLAKLKPHVDSHGHLHLTPDQQVPAAFIALCRSLPDPLSRILLCSILSSPVHRDRGWPAIASSTELMAVLSGWFKGAVQEWQGGGGALLVGKLVDLMAVLPVGVEQLVESKVGRVLKRVLGACGEGGSGGENEQIRVKASALFERWSAMADSASNSASGTVVNEVPEPSTQATAVPVGRAMLMTTTTPPTQQTHQSQSLPVTRPMSADDIQKEKKRRAYLESIGVTSTGTADGNNTASTTDSNTTNAEIPGLSTITTADPGPDTITTHAIDPVNKKIKTDRRVSFPADPALLAQVRFFVPDPADPAPSFSAVHQGEASYAFDRLRHVMEEDVDWKRPSSVGTVNNTNSGFARGEEERERTTLSCSYRSIDQIPADPVDLSKREIGATTVAVIPFKDAAFQTRHLKTVKGEQIVSPEMLSALWRNISAVIAPAAHTVPPPPPPPQQHQHQQQLQQARQAGVKKRVRPVCKFYKEGVPASCRSGASCPFRHGQSE